MGRKIKYVGRSSGEPEVTLPDGQVVQQDEVIEVSPRLARQLLSAPGQATDDQAEWVPAGSDE